MFVAGSGYEPMRSLSNIILDQGCLPTPLTGLEAHFSAVHVGWQRAARDESPSGQTSAEQKIVK